MKEELNKDKVQEQQPKKFIPKTGKNFPYYNWVERLEDCHIDYNGIYIFYFGSKFSTEERIFIQKKIFTFNDNKEWKLFRRICLAHKLPLIQKPKHRKYFSLLTKWK